MGFVSFIPFILAAGPLAGYFTGNFLQKKLNLSSLCVFFGIAFGFLISITEIIKIIKAVNRINKNK